MLICHKLLSSLIINTNVVNSWNRCLGYFVGEHYEHQIKADIPTSLFSHTHARKHTRTHTHTLPCPQCTEQLNRMLTVLLENIMNQHKKDMPTTALSCSHTPTNLHALCGKSDILTILWENIMDSDTLVITHTQTHLNALPYSIVQTAENAQACSSEEALFGCVVFLPGAGGVGGQPNKMAAYAPHPPNNLQKEWERPAKFQESSLVNTDFCTKLREYNKIRILTRFKEKIKQP